VLLRQAAKRGPGQTVTLFVHRGAIRRTLVLPADGLRDALSS
jgi:hypothetical protein